MRRAGMWTGIAVAALRWSPGAVVVRRGRRLDRHHRRRAACPTDPVKVVVTVDQWADIVRQLGGNCAEVTTIIQGADVDPHEYEPTPADNAKFLDADLVVMNGLGYDEWANKMVDTLSPSRRSSTPERSSA